ncbi:MAG TPA: hypothetical protein VHT96_10190 [Clostridia bacterium]|nr:hypothetical protein [Clostridia bacterium]
MRFKILVITTAILFTIISVSGCSSNRYKSAHGYKPTYIENSEWTKELGSDYGYKPAYTEDSEWIKELGYEVSEIHELTVNGPKSCPEIPVEIGDKEYKLLFDTGCAMGLNLTNIIGDEIAYTLLGETELTNRDGSHQGWAKRVKISEMSVLGDSYQDIETNISDWSLYQSLKFNGIIGLAYFKSKVITLDYSGRKIAVGRKPVDYKALNSNKYVVLPLYKTTSRGKQDLLFFEAEYNNKPITVYMDTGKNYSYLHNPDSRNSVGNTSADISGITLKVGNMEIIMNDLTEANIAQEDGLPYPTMIELNSDQIWKCNLLVTIDLIDQKIILSKLKKS